MREGDIELFFIGSLFARELGDDKDPLELFFYRGKCRDRILEYLEDRDVIPTMKMMGIREMVCFDGLDNLKNIYEPYGISKNDIINHNFPECMKNNRCFILGLLELLCIPKFENRELKSIKIVTDSEKQVEFLKKNILNSVEFDSQNLEDPNGKKYHLIIIDDEQFLQSYVSSNSCYRISKLYRDK